jgi:nuclear transport factor 2 (NTF2) superfamily protein
MNTQRPPLPPFTPKTAIEKVRLAEDGWNRREARMRRSVMPGLFELLAQSRHG